VQISAEKLCRKANGKGNMKDELGCKQRAAAAEGMQIITNFSTRKIASQKYVVQQRAASREPRIESNLMTKR